MGDPHAIRKREDLAKIKVLQRKIPGILEIGKVIGDPPRSITLCLRIPTAKNGSYPRERQETNEVEIQLPANYPFPPGPMVQFKTPIWNPNVYPSGKWCFGGWNVTENLELFVVRLMKVIALDPTIINPRSAANGDAARWYLQIQKRQPDLFPTVSVSGLIAEAYKPKISWRNIK